jgi:hypothetical protein
MNNEKYPIKGHFDQKGGVSNYYDTPKLIEIFKTHSVIILSSYRIDFEWVDEFDETCSVRLKLVEIDTGNKTIRGIMLLMPFFSDFIGPAGKFLVEGELLKDGKSQRLVYQDEHRASPSTKYVMELVTMKVATQFAKHLKYKLSGIRY